MLKILENSLRTLPKSALGGSQHACIFVETIPEEKGESSDIVTVSRTAVKVFADVLGETKKDAEIQSLNTDTFVINGKVSASSVVENIGNIDIKPTLALKITDLNGETVFNNTNIAMIFPENSDELKVEWPETPAFGIYNVIALANVLDKDLKVEKMIFVVPGWFVCLLLIVIATIIIVVIYYYKIHRAKGQRRRVRKGRKIRLLRNK